MHVIAVTIPETYRVANATNLIYIFLRCVIKAGLTGVTKGDETDIRTHD
jgi:hypothetical protein